MCGEKNITPNRNQFVQTDVVSYVFFGPVNELQFIYPLAVGGLVHVESEIWN